MSATPGEILRKKRFGAELNETEIRAFVKGVVDGEFADYQTAALLMAICIHGMTERETLALTLAMAKSGDTLHMEDVPGVKADKHSTGGVGDTTSLILTPLVAACGVKMAKMSGRGLGFTGGTLDKLESIPGMNVNIPIHAFKDIVRKVGCAIVGQSAELAPADKVLYALRDVTETVDCLPLIVSSILSKKLAAGCDVVVLDVKMGSGALMETEEQATKLAQAMVRIGNLSGKHFSALITDMNQPLGNYIGNALEVEEAIDVLSGKIAGDLRDVSLELGAHILLGAKAVETMAEGRRLLLEKLKNGEGLAKLGEMIAAQGGNPKVIGNTSLLPKARYSAEVKAQSDGYVAAIQTADVGMAAKMLGAGRERKEDAIDPSVGIILRKRIGDFAHAGESLFTVKFQDSAKAAGAMTKLRQAVRLEKQPVPQPKLIRAVVE